MKGSVVFPDVEHCIVCHNPNYECHHMIHGVGRRKIADKYGLTAPLCHKHHMALHDTGDLDLDLKQLAQTYYEDNIGTRGAFIKEFGKSWL